MAQETGILLMLAAMDSECVRIAGPKHSRNPLRAANWWGSDLRPVYYDKQEVIIDRPRIRGKNKKEIPLATYEAFRDPNGMKESVLKNMILGISSRDYEEACQQHKRRNVLKHLPEKHQNAVDARISAAYKMSDYDEAKKSLDLTVRYLEKRKS
jgi:hypothetical protein